MSGTIIAKYIWQDLYIKFQGKYTNKAPEKLGRSKICKPWNILSLTVQITLTVRQTNKSHYLCCREDTSMEKVSGWRAVYCPV
jgi:hypothetical protein